MADYRNKMGSGQVNATAFLKAIAGDVGVDMHFPNLYISEGESVAVSPARYFVNGQEMTYSVAIDDTSVVSVAKSGENLLFTAHKSGTTTATVVASGGVEHNFNITVRRNTNQNGWL